MYLGFQDTVWWFTERHPRGKLFARVNQYHNPMNTLKEISVHNSHTLREYLQDSLTDFSRCRDKAWQASVGLTEPHKCEVRTAPNFVGCPKTHASIYSISLQHACSNSCSRFCAGETKMLRTMLLPQRPHSPVRGRYASCNPRIQNTVWHTTGAQKI